MILNTNNLADWLKYQEASHPLEIDLGLERVLEIAAKLPSLNAYASRFKFYSSSLEQKASRIAEAKFTQNLYGSKFSKKSVKIINIAGTNGKGSTATFLQNLLLSAGYKTGLYTSPHIKNYTERFLINGLEVEEVALIEVFKEIYQAKADLSLSYFEWATLAAFAIFAKSELDFWIMEVGLGGRLDAVNIVNADIGIIVSIGRDHEDYLGTSLNAIASEKAGIFCKNQIGIYASRLMPISIATKSYELGIKLLRAGIDFNYNENIVELNWRGLGKDGEIIELNLPKTSIASANASGALQAFCLLTTKLDTQILRQAVTKTQLCGRMQRLGGFLLDVAHNPSAMVHLVNKLDKKTRRLAIIGMLKDKDITKSLQILDAYLDAFYMVSLPTSRGTSKEAMFAYGVKAGINKDKISMLPSLEEAIKLAQKRLEAKEVDEVVILGSFITLELALKILQPSEEVL